MHERYVKGCPGCEMNAAYIRAILAAKTSEDHDRANAEYLNPDQLGRIVGHVNHYSIVNQTTRYTLSESDDLRAITAMWHKVPRRKASDLLLMDNYTGEIMRTKERAA